jgi:hypothetical protein
MWTERAPSRRSSYNHPLKHHQPVCEAPSTRLPLSAENPQLSPSLVAVVGDPLKIAGLALPNRSHPCSTCFIGSRSGITKFPHRKSQTRSQLLMAPTYHEIVAIAGLLRRNCRIVGSVRVGRHAVLNGGRRECTTGSERSGGYSPYTVGIEVTA